MNVPPTQSDDAIMARKRRGGLRLLNPIHLRTFVDVMSTGSFASTARRLGYTSSAVSQHISALERATRVRLFHRDTSGIRPTSAAGFVLVNAQRALGGWQAVTDDFAELAAGVSGPLRVGSFPTASQTLVPHALARLAQQRPQIQVRLTEGEPDELAAAIRTDELDLAIVYEYAGVPETLRGIEVAEVLLTEPLRLVVPANHPFAQHDSVSLEALRDEAWITTRQGTAAVLLLERLSAGEGFTPRVVHQSNDYAVIQELVSAGLGVALVPVLGCTADPRRRHPSLSTTSASAPQRRTSVVVGDVRDSPVTDHLLTQLRSVARTAALEDPQLTATTLL